MCGLQFIHWLYLYAFNVGIFCKMDYSPTDQPTVCTLQLKCLVQTDSPLIPTIIPTIPTGMKENTLGLTPTETRYKFNTRLKMNYLSHHLITSHNVTYRRVNLLLPKHSAYVTEFTNKTELTGLWIFADVT